MSVVVNLVHMGDSITAGQYIDPRLRWTTLVENRLSARYSGTAIKVNALNCGVSGETTRMGLERFPAAVQEAHPDVLTLQYGLNDCNYWATDRGVPRVSEQAFKANLTEMIARVKRFGAKETILATNHVTLRRTPMINGEHYEEANARYSELVRSVSAETGVTLCDIRKVFDSYTEAELEGLLLPYPDHLHLSVDGNQVYADAIGHLIEDAIEAIIMGIQVAGGLPREKQN